MLANFRGKKRSLFLFVFAKEGRGFIVVKVVTKGIFPPTFSQGMLTDSKILTGFLCYAFQFLGLTCFEAAVLERKVSSKKLCRLFCMFKLFH